MRLQKNNKDALEAKEWSLQRIVESGKIDELGQF